MNPLISTIPLSILVALNIILGHSNYVAGNTLSMAINMFTVGFLCATIMCITMNEVMRS